MLSFIIGGKMKLPVTEYQLETNVHNAVDISIAEEESHMILTFLRDNIYENPKKDLVRELVSNALDSHVTNKVDRPIEITLPNAFSNRLIIRDFGSGLSKEFMTTRYTKVGYSTKRDTNDVTGCWGLGRLSALSYTDTYYVDSYINGIVSSYVVSLYEENGATKISLVYIGDKETQEDNGLKVSIPIKDKDRSAFINLLKEHCQYIYENTPLINNQPARTLVKNIESQSGSWYTVYTGKGYGVTLLIGGMPHFIERIAEFVKPPLVNSVSNIRYLRNEYDYLQAINLVINVPIGSITQTASKDIQKSDTTKETITKLLLKVNSEIAEVYQKKVDTLERYDEVIRYIHSLYYKKRLINWNGLDISHSIEIPNCIIKELVKTRSGYQLKKVKDHITSSQTLVILINDLPKLKGQEIGEKLREASVNMSNVYLLYNSKLTPEIDNTVYNFKYLSEVISIEEYEDSSLRRSRRKVDREKITVYRLRSNKSRNLLSSVNRERIQPQDIKYYLPLLEDMSKYYSNEFYTALGYSYPIYLVKDLSKLPNTAINFEEFIEQRIKELLVLENKLLECAQLYYCHNDVDYTLSTLVYITHKYDLGEVSRVTKEYKRVRDIFFNLSTAETNILRFALETYEETTNTFVKDYQYIKAKYPFIVKNADYLSAFSREELENYIKLVEQDATISL